MPDYVSVIVQYSYNDTLGDFFERVKKIKEEKIKEGYIYTGMANIPIDSLSVTLLFEENRV